MFPFPLWQPPSSLYSHIHNHIFFLLYLCYLGSITEGVCFGWQHLGSGRGLCLCEIWLHWCRISGLSVLWLKRWSVLKLWEKTQRWVGNVVAKMNYRSRARRRTDHFCWSPGSPGKDAKCLQTMLAISDNVKQLVKRFHLITQKVLAT